MIHRIDPHIVRHGDLMTGYEELQALTPPIDFVYSDPPWGDSNLKYWQTMNAKMNGSDPDRAAPLGAFLTKFFDVLKASCKPSAVVFLEYGQRWKAEIVRQAQRIGLQVQAIATPKYGKPQRSLLLFVLAWQAQQIPTGYADRVSSTKGGMATLEAATAPFRLQAGQTILDPCCGLGYTARLALAHGLTFYGNELNGKRLEKTRTVLEKGFSRAHAGARVF